MSSTSLNTAYIPPQNVEPWICKHCLGVNAIEGPPYHRRPKKDHHMWLEEEVFLAVKARCVPYHSFNNGLSMLMYELDKYRMMDNKALLRQAIKVRSVDDEITRL